MLTRALGVRLAASVLLAAAAISACGPFFGIEALRNRSQSLLAPPSISFIDELKSLVPPPADKFSVVESSEINRAAVEAKELAAGAYVVGADLPAAVRLYTAGAISFHAGDLGGARSSFTQILSLPENHRIHRDVWALYNLGRIAVARDSHTEAVANFERVRTLVRQSAPDPMGLAVASFGEQARSAWNAGLTAEAVHLYAQQASYGSATALNSLALTATRILQDTGRLDAAIEDEITRRLLFICLNNDSGHSFFTGPESQGIQASAVEKTLAALERHKLTNIAGAGLLAGAAYSIGRFDVAERLAKLENVPLASWVQAKLALRRGDRPAALEFYRRSLHELRSPELDRKTLEGELAVLHVSRSAYAQALDLFVSAAGEHTVSDARWIGFSDYWGDIAYLAERVLTIRELQGYVNTRPRSAQGATDPLQSRLRSVLARRLMRAGRRGDAFPYFDDRQTRTAAEQYDEQLSRVARWWSLSSSRAEAWFKAAKLARFSGMEILGYEKEPDAAMWNGEFPPQYDDAQVQSADAPYTSLDEHERVAASTPPRPVRFQYRLTAVDLATRAADHLPPRSQAFAAVLCNATGWLDGRQPDIADQLYRSYLKRGAHVPWASHFGHSCPQPNFTEASWWFLHGQTARRLQSHVRAHPVPFGTAVTLFAAILFATPLYLYRLRRR